MVGKIGLLTSNPYMPFLNPETYPFTRDQVLWSPKQSGVYGLRNSDRWILIAETQSIQESLEKHLKGDNPCIVKNAPTSFACETCFVEKKRAARRDELVAELIPLCK